MSAQPVKLGVNIDHVATLLEARGTTCPGVLEAAAICEAAGAVGIILARPVTIAVAGLAAKAAALGVRVTATWSVVAVAAAVADLAGAAGRIQRLGATVAAAAVTTSLAPSAASFLKSLYIKK